LSNVLAVDDPMSGVETAALEPCSETPLKLAVLAAGAKRLLAFGFAAGAAGGVDADEEGVLRPAGIFDVKPGGGVADPGRGVAGLDEGETVPAGGVVVPDGCHADGGDDDAGG
jgi:hypothetical protein